MYHVNLVLRVPSATDLFDCFHEMMLRVLIETLYALDDVPILFALDGDGQGHAAQDEDRADIVIFRCSLKVWHVECGRGFLQDVFKVLGKETVETFECTEAEDPVVGQLGRSASKLAEVVGIAVKIGVSGAANGLYGATYTRARTWNNAAPSLRSTAEEIGRARSNVEKKAKNASISFLSPSDIEIRSTPDWMPTSCGCRESWPPRNLPLVII